MRRYTGHMNGQKYLGNVNTMEVHDLDSERTLCQIDEIIRAGHDRPYNSIDEARRAGFDNCHWCIGGSTR